jgi:hypothetical protein
MLEDEIEHAFDDGILSVFSAGNDNGDDATTCTIVGPSDLPKVLTVNAYDTNTGNCASFPSTRCLLDQTSCGGGGCSARGGATASVAGAGSIDDAVRLVDIVAPNDISFTTSSVSGSDGTVGSANFVGTSAAAPHIAGLAAVVKDYMLSNGSSWINSPGRLFTVMLGMTDRHFSSNPASGGTWTTQLAATRSYWYGLGRIHMRRLDDAGLAPFYWNLGTFTFSSASTATYYPFGKDDLPSGIGLLKCVLLQDEDMSGKSDISDMRLEVRIRPNASPSSCSGTATASQISDNYDTKKIAALGNTTFTNRCAEVKIVAEAVTGAGITTHAFCYYSGVVDDEAP